MAKQFIEIVADDITGVPGAKTRTFALGNLTYQIDLTDDSYDMLALNLAEFIRAASPVVIETSAPVLRREVLKRSLTAFEHAQRNAEIREAYWHTEATATTLGKKYGVTTQRIYQIVKG